MSYLVGIGATPVDAPAPGAGPRQAPIYPLQVGNHGAWLEVRASPSEGSCGVHGYPCMHPGVDVYGPAGTTVVAPEDGVIVLAGDGNSAPFVGYGPWFVIIQGASGKFHFLGHLDPSAASAGPAGTAVTAGQPVGVTSSADHTHWEVRSKPAPDFAAGEDNFTNNVDPLAWLDGGSLLGPALVVGGAALLAYLALR